MLTGQETLQAEMVATVPKFSDLDENDPSSAEGLTGIFDRIRDERKHGPKPPMINIDPDFSIDPTNRGRNSNSVRFLHTFGLQKSTCLMTTLTLSNSTLNSIFFQLALDFLKVNHER